MQRINRRELGNVLDCLRTIYAALDLEAFPRQVVAGLRRVVSAPFGSYNEIDRGATRIRYVVEPVEATVPHLEMAVREYQHEQPVVANYLRTGDGSPKKLSDFLSILNLHRPHVMTAYANAETVSALRRTAPPAGGAPETRRREIIVMRPSGRHLISPRAAYWFDHYFANGPRHGELLPAA